MDSLNRRSFLANIARLGALFGSGSIAQLLSGEQFALGQTESASATPAHESDEGPLTLELKGRSYKVDPWTGDNFLLGHRLRDSEIPTAKVASEKRCDFVIVGGGLAGLTAAYHLRNEDFVLLEQYATFGGVSRGDSYRGINFSYGSYIAGTGDNITDELFDVLGLKPVKLASNRNSWHIAEKYFVGVESGLKDGLSKDFAEFRQKSEPIWNAIKTASEAANPAVSLMEDKTSRELDLLSFASVLRSFSPAFIRAVDRFCRSRNCIAPERLSALAGYQLTHEMFEEVGTLPGGNQTISDAILRKLPPDRCATNSFVWSVAVTESGTEVLYSDNAGNLQRVLAKQAIVAVPPLVAARIIKHVDNMSKAAMMGFRYGSYLVANLLLARKSFEGTFDNFYDEQSGFTDLVVADTVYRSSKTYTPNIGQVLTVYRPYAPGSEGRPLLLEGSRKNFAGEIAEQVSRISDKLEASLERIVLSRWGHVMPVMNVGYYAKMSKVASINYPNLILAHSSIQGQPCVDSAARAGRSAARQALKLSR
ncbi:MAG TPA: FAD-dependent oxidoreductase [Oculatellaceae cyanobacterium]